MVVPTKLSDASSAGGGVGERRGGRGVERDNERVRESLLTSFASRWISERMCSISAVPAEEGAETAATCDFHNFIGHLCRVVLSGVDASTILTFWGNLCKNNSRKNELSTPGRSPISCCILRRIV